MASILAKLVGGKGPSRELQDALKALLLDSKASFERAVAYVHDGSSPEILSTLAAQDTKEISTVLGDPGNINAHWWVDQKLTQRLQDCSGRSPAQVRMARAALYELDAGTSTEQEIRLARLLAAVTVDITGVKDGIPSWFTVLVNDVASRADGRRNGERTTGAYARRWSPAYLEQVAREGEVADPVVATLRSLLEDYTPSSWQGNPLEIYHRHPELEPYLVAHRDEVVASIPKLSAGGRTAFLKIISQRLVPTFADVAIGLVADKAKGVRREADLLIAKVDEKQQMELMVPLLLTASTSVLSDIADRVASLPGGAQAIEKQLEQVKGTRAAALTKALERAKVLEAPVAAIEVPPFAKLTESEITDAVVEAGMLGIGETIARAEKVLTDKQLDPRDWRRRQAERERKEAKALERGDFRALGHLLSGTADRREGELRAADFAARIDLLGKVPGASTLHRLRLEATRRDGAHFSWYHVRSHLAPDTDLRAVDAALRTGGVPGQKVDQAIDSLVFYNWRWLEEPLEPAAVWPYYATRIDVLERHLAEVDTPVAPTRALEILGAFPAVPVELLPRVVSLAMGDRKTLRRAAQETLEAHPGARLLAEQALSDGKADIRGMAAVWLQRLGDPASVPALRAALAKEKREVVRAALLSALEALGEDISEALSPERLLAEATKGLEAKRPTSMSWFPYAGVPQLAWADGSAVPPEIGRWWAVLAVKLKMPAGTGLIERYISQLDGPSRAALGRFALSAWIAQDTRRPSPEDSRAHAEDHAQRSYDAAQQWVKRNPGHQWAQERAALSVDDHYRNHYRWHQATYLGSATADKGLLALTVGMPGGELAAAVQHYLKTHLGRRSQAEALVRALAANGEQAAIQQLLAVSRRFKQATVQEVARQLAEQIAEDRGWTADQLADRTIQTAGFDDDGVLRLDLGNRVVTGRITEKFTLELRNPEGKVIKALPATRADDDPECYKAAKAQLSASRKELKAVVQLQTSRLYEAMCTGRTWTASEFTEYVIEHPVMSRLAARLVWVVDPGAPTQKGFRPGDGGALIDVVDDDVALAPDAVVGLAHTVVLGAEPSARWREHLNDYDVKPLFGQFDGAVPEFAANASAVDDRKGWLTDSFSIRGRATKRGYTRSMAEDAGWFIAYTKPYPSVGLRVDLEFTGAFLPEENIPAAMTDLVFVRTDRSFGRPGRVALSEVPAVLLAEAYGDYVHVAEAGAFDPDWQKKSSY